MGILGSIRRRKVGIEWLGFSLMGLRRAGGSELGGYMIDRLGIGLRVRRLRKARSWLVLILGAP
jgi:hypothetical protein